MRFPHWQFFESLDDELHSLSRIVEFSKDNFSTYSVHFTRLYLSVCSEVDVVAKLLCGRIAQSENPENIDQYRALITPKFPNFSALRIEIQAHELDFQPWASWGSGKNPHWWKSYNQVKHERNIFYRDANLGNLLESTAGLLVLLTYHHQPDLYDQNRLIQPDFKTMRIDSKYVGVLRWGFDYKLPDFGKSPTPGQKF
jgi:hypothetical protein